jgi:hypothetical protein
MLFGIVLGTNYKYCNPLLTTTKGIYSMKMGIFRDYFRE